MPCAAELLPYSAEFKLTHYQPYLNSDEDLIERYR
jgi:hypothetical protein